VSPQDENGEMDEPSVVPWEYSDKAVLLIKAYMDNFPMLIEGLRQRPSDMYYEATTLFGANHAVEVEKVRQWLSQQETSFLPRVPLTTAVLPREAIRAIERAANEMQSQKKRFGNRIQIRTVEIRPDEVFACGSHRASDAPLKTSNRPELGDRVVNLLAQGVPFGLRGTVIACHKHSACVEVLFDEEFIGGTSLQGSCSNFRGKLVPWYTVLKYTAELPLPPQPEKDKRPLSAIIQRSQSAPTKSSSSAKKAQVQGQGRVVPVEQQDKAAGKQRKGSVDKASPSASNGQQVKVLVKHGGTTMIKAIPPPQRPSSGSNIFPPPSAAKKSAPSIFSPPSSKKASIPEPQSVSLNPGKMLLSALQSSSQKVPAPSSSESSGGGSSKTTTTKKVTPPSQQAPAEANLADTKGIKGSPPRSVGDGGGGDEVAKVNRQKKEAADIGLGRFRMAKGPPEESTDCGFRLTRSVQGGIKPKPAPVSDLQRVLNLMSLKGKADDTGKENPKETTTTVILEEELKVEGITASVTDAPASSSNGIDMSNATAVLKTVLKVEVRERNGDGEKPEEVSGAPEGGSKSVSEQAAPPPVPGPPPNPFQPYMMPPPPQGLPMMYPHPMAPPMYHHPGGPGPYGYMPPPYPPGPYGPPVMGPQPPGPYLISNPTQDQLVAVQVGQKIRASPKTNQPHPPLPLPR